MFCCQLTLKISDKVIFNTKGSVALTKHQKVQGFPYWGMQGDAYPPASQKFVYPPPHLEKSPQQIPPPKKIFYSPPTKYVHVITQ